MFFDDYPLFYESSDTAASPVRLNLRHEAMITSNQDILAGARVLDLASHDGRWSFAALRAGAEHVIGVEARAGLVDAANKTFAEYGVPTQDYEFVQGDMFRILQERRFDVDVVMCLGFIYHTLRYGELFRGIIDAGPRGWIDAEWGRSAEHNRQAKFYRLTKTGQRQLRDETAQWERMASAVQRILAGAEEA